MKKGKKGETPNILISPRDLHTHATAHERQKKERKNHFDSTIQTRGCPACSCPRPFYGSGSASVSVPSAMDAAMCSAIQRAHHE